MKLQKEWREWPELFFAVVEALESGMDKDEYSVIGRDETNGYGDEGFITIRTSDGRYFQIDLYELR